MRKDLQLLRSFYRLSLNLFPKPYRDEFGEELQDVFGLSLDEAAAKGAPEVGRLVLRELVSLPTAVFLEHLRERRNTKMTRSFEAYFDFASGSWKEFLTVLLPFSLTGAFMPLFNYLLRAGITSGSTDTVVMLALFVLFLILLGIGMKKGMPRWSLPYIGFFLAILSIYFLSAILGTPIYLIFGNFRDQSLLFMDILWDGIFWYGLLLATVLFVAVTSLTSKLQHFKEDWTLLCFLFYGAIPFVLWISFDEYVGDDPYTLLAFLVLALGAWIYLRSANEWTRFATLFIALVLAMSIATVGKALLIPTQSWPFPLDAGLVRSEVKHTIITGGWLALGMLIPLGIKFLPRSTVSAHISSSEG